MQPPRPDVELAKGTRLLDRYTVVEPFDSGGMATLYRARDERLDRIVCVKLLRRTLVEGSGSTSGRAVFHATYAHFLEEALALSKLQHPNTLRIYDFGYLGIEPDALPEERAPFHVSEFLSGGNLDALVRARGALPEGEALDILERISGAVEEAHGFGILHRDIKPSNILFARVGQALIPKLADFGIAHSSVPLGAREGPRESPRDNPGRVRPAVALFSPRWAAPEQLTGGAEGPETDVYALSLLVHFMLTGRPAFEDPQIRRTFEPRVASDDYVEAALRSSGLRAPLAEVLFTGLRVEPGHRFPGPAELFRALREMILARPALRASRPSLAHPAGSPPASSSVPPTRRSAGAGGPRSAVPVRLVEVRERADLALDGPRGQVRFRVSFLPATSNKVNVKGLNCFVFRPGGRPTSAVVMEGDGVVTFVGSDRGVLGEAALLFGDEAPGGRVFVAEGQPVLVPSSQGEQSIALLLDAPRELVVVVQR